MKIKENIMLNGENFIFNPSTGDSFKGNAVACEIISAMKRGEPEQQIKAGLLGRYEVSRAQLDRDWEDWVLQLKAIGLTEV